MIRGSHIAIASGGSNPLPLLVSAFFLFLASQTLFAQQQDERSVRTAFIYNLTKYVDWPKAHDGLNICVFSPEAVDHSPIDRDLKRVLQGKASAGRSVHVTLGLPGIETQRCSIAYFPGSSHDQFHKFKWAADQPVLTVGEEATFVREGGMIAFVRSGDSMQIQVNIDAVRAAGLSISSRLLDLAIIVHTKIRG